MRLQLSIEESSRGGFIYQAEDVIRDVAVTGVQTCALPISHRASRGALTVRQIEKLAARRLQGKSPQPPPTAHLDPNIRSAVEDLQRHLGTKITLRMKTDRKSVV